MPQPDPSPVGEEPDDVSPEDSALLLEILRKNRPSPEERERLLVNAQKRQSSGKSLRRR